MNFNDLRMSLLKQRIEEELKPDAYKAQRARARHHVESTGHCAVKFNETRAVCNECGELPDA